ncbi:MAG: 2'-5' RNA ligase family protein [Clostridia bacterium]|nr:2'-5' RNA ligase family protein [Clostridia bacterium]
MFLWVGAVFENNAEDEIRSITNKLNENYNLSTVVFSLPQHISLKISFECDDYKKVIDYIKTQLSVFESFDVEISDVSKIDGSLIWLDISENETLRKIHDLLNYSLLRDFNIPLKSFDGDEFKFHSTLFFDSSINEKHQALIDEFKKHFLLPRKYVIKKIKFAISQTLTPGEFEVVDMIVLD